MRVSELKPHLVTPLRAEGLQQGVSVPVLTVVPRVLVGIQPGAFSGKFTT